jgi:hypothetical protein
MEIPARMRYCLADGVQQEGMMLVRAILIGLLALVIAAPAGAATGERIALVIGNGGYRHVPPLVNPANDAADLGETLRRIGFEVTRIDDGDYEGLRRALHGFRNRAEGAEVALIYFAGHGIEIQRNNYLLPVDARLEKPGDVTFQAIPLAMLRQAAEPATTLSLVIVDACRNNPFLQRMQTATRSLSRGLGMVEPVGQNRLVAFAAKEGTVAADGDGRNSPYARALITELSTPGVEIGKLFRRVRDRVYNLTDGEQEPALYGSLSSADFYFQPPEEEPSTQVAARSSELGTRRALELEFWRTIKDSDRPADFEDYLALFPDGVFASLAERRLAELAGAAGGGDASGAGEPETAEAGPDGAPEEVALVEPEVPRAAPGAPVARRPGGDRAAVAALAPASGAVAALPGALGEASGPDPQIEVFRPEPEPEDELPAAVEKEARRAGLSVIVPETLPGGEVGTEPEPEPEPISLDRARIRDLQARLNILGHDAGPADGLMGPRTRAALRDFQRGTGLPVTGDLDRAVVEAIEAEVGGQKVAAYHARIREAIEARERRAREEAERRRQRQARESASEPRAEPEPRAARVTPEPEPQPAAEPEETVAAAPEPEPAGEETESAGFFGGSGSSTGGFGSSDDYERRGGK